MSFIPIDDFLEHAHSVFRDFRSTKPFDLIPDLKDSHIFVLGEDRDFHIGVKEIASDLIDECRSRVPMPFSDISCLSIVRNSDASLDLVESDAEPCWTLDRLIVDPPFWSHFFPVDSPCPKRIKSLSDGTSTELDPKNHPTLSRIMILRYQFVAMNKRTPKPLWWGVFYRGVVGSGLFVDVRCEDPMLGVESKLGPHGWLTYETSMILEQAAAISHPMNYIVRETPHLTPREATRLRSRGERPDRKRERYIVVDHDVLVQMSKGHFGSHASPVPHERRGHWRRLAERCVQARATKTRTWVRPSFVGDPTFSGEKARYEVLLDVNAAGRFGKR